MEPITPGPDLEPPDVPHEVPPLPEQPPLIHPPGQPAPAPPLEPPVPQVDRPLDLPDGID